MRTTDQMVASLIESRKIREQIIHELGEIPESILRHDRTVKAIDLMAETRSYASTSNHNGSGLNAALTTVFDVSGQSCRDGALSRFSQNIGRILLRLFSKQGDIVVDPFAGHNSRMELCWRNGRHYIGHDISREFMEVNRRIADMLREEGELDLFGQEHYGTWIKLNECDSRQMPTEDQIGNFTITSPPYWDLEDYGDELGQLGHLDYDGFLTGLRAVAAENYRCLKPGSFCIWAVNDFRKNGKFYPYHEHVAQVLRSVGFEQHDTLIADLGPAIRAAFASQIISTRIVPKRHEYLLVFRRPERKGVKIRLIC